MHSLLLRQLKRHLGDPANIPEQFRPFVQSVNEAYKQFDADRLMLERSLELSSQELLQANTEMRAVFRLFPDVFFRLDAQGVILDCNAGPGLDMMAPREMIGRRIQDIPLAGVAERFEEAIGVVRDRRRIAVIEYPVAKGGAVYHYEASFLPLLGHQILVFVRDITQRKLAEAERARLFTAIEQAAESIIITDDEGKVQFVNPAFERITGYARSEVIGRDASMLRPERADPAVYERLRQTLLAGAVWSGRLAGRRKDGRHFDVDAAISPIRDGAGHIINYVTVSRDVTREVQLEEQLRQSHKMEAVGRLAGGIAHDFNNLLTAILGNTELVLRRMPVSDPNRQDMEEIKKASLRAASLTSQLLAFGRRQVLHPTALNLNAIVLDMSRMLRRTIGENIELVTNLEQKLEALRADPVQVEQVIINLALNARDAMPQGGRLTIETANVTIDEEQARLYADARPGAYVQLTVSDTGVGMDAETQSHLFEPFFTTKEIGRGTGLGLATIYGIVKQSGGHISVSSKPGQGTTFCIYLPRAQGPLEPALEEQVAADTLHGAETILLVEDEDQVRQLASRMLQSFGYRVLEASSGAVALDVARHNNGRIDLLLTDVVMPGLHGEALAGKIKEMKPDIRVLYMSGHPDSTIVGMGVLSSGKHLLKKPFSSTELGQKIREVLDNP